MLRVIIESPFAAKDEKTTKRNLVYLQRCIMDSLKRGEAPFASHGFYPQVLRDSDPMERRLGIQAGFAWHRAASLVVAYIDYGITEGMREGINNAHKNWTRIEYRTIGENPNEEGGD